MEQQSFKCEICGIQMTDKYIKNENGIIYIPKNYICEDHVIPKSKGTTKYKNTGYICKSCNSSKKNKNSWEHILINDENLERIIYLMNYEKKHNSFDKENMLKNCNTLISKYKLKIKELQRLLKRI